MIQQKDFYFIRHGETDHNVAGGMLVGDHPEHEPLNARGQEQAQAAEPIIAKLPFTTICSSPLLRVQQTKKLICPTWDGAHHMIDELGECTGAIWLKMAKGESHPDVTQFMERVCAGVNQALEHPGPVLIVAHGGIHFTLCHKMGISGHSWKIGNCQPVHFTYNKGWSATKITEG
ncbi:MAG: histidine phosphatase family protein [Simkaniaceae bacterium]|nr:histidine phosphatase family protein [Simkaniaceae bacterium]